MSLPDDLVLEIFPCVKDVVTLFRCAAACKRWRDILVSKPSFLRRCLPEEACRSSPFAGFFTQQRRRKSLRVPCFIPGPRPVLGPRRLLSSFVPGMGDLAVPLTSRHGLLLVHRGKVLFVCDPLAGTFKPLPQLDHHWGSLGCFTGYAMLTAADCSRPDHNDELPFFKVMIIVMAQHPMYYDIYTYSSVGELGWNKLTGSAGDEGQAIHVQLLQHNAVVWGGAAHWYFRGTSGFYILDVSADTGQVTTRKVVSVMLYNRLSDPTYDEPYLGIDTEGRLVFLCLRIDGTRLDIRTRDDRETDFHIRLEPPSHSITNLIEQETVHTFLGEKNGNLIICDNHRRIYIADCKTGEMQEMTDFPRSHGLSRREIVLMEMDWPALFISRLGVVAT